MRHFCSFPPFFIWIQSISKKKLLFLLFSLLFTSISCSNSQTSENEVVFFAASSLTDAISEIVHQYEREHPAITVRLNFAGSSQLTTQLIEGAPAHIFASANETQIERLIDETLSSPESIQFFASNQLVLIVPIDNPAQISSIADLAQSQVKFITASEDVPIGKYTRQSLAKIQASGEFSSGFEEAVLSNIVSEEANVRQIVTKIELGEADAAIVYQSDVHSHSSSLTVISIPHHHNVVARYPITLLERGNSSDHASGLIDLIQSSTGQRILKKWGFSPP